MAVYKSTNCYPFMNNIDVRTTLVKGVNEVTCRELSCKVDTSNINVTGYSIRILDENNNVVFPVSSSLRISPISELRGWSYKEGGVNSGVNGTVLKIPFFQSQNERVTTSYNAIYYKPNFMVDHLIYSSDLFAERNNFEKPENWKLNATTGNYQYDWDSDTEELDKKRDRIFLDGEVLVGGEIVLVANNSSQGIPSGFFVAIKKADSNGVFTELKEITNSKWTNVSYRYYSVISKGKNFSNKTIRRDAISGRFSFLSDDTKQWADVEGNNVGINFTGTSMYKWEITLYQGDCEIYEEDAFECDYTNVDTSFYDMTLASGTVLGSNEKRIQIAYEDPYNGLGQENANCVLPSQQEGTLILQGKWMSFGTEPSSYFRGTRSNIRSYDSSYGHVYPISESVDFSQVTENSYVQFYKRSNDPNMILDTDGIIKYGVESALTFYYYSSDAPGTQLADLAALEALSINKRLYGVSRSQLSQINASLGAVIGGSDLILLTGQGSGGNMFQNGVYEVYERPDLSFNPTDIVLLKRVAPYDTWGSYIGRIFYVENYIQADGSVIGANIESMAGSDVNAALWNPSVVNGAAKGSLPLNLESPILLFGSLIKEDRYFDAVGTITRGDSWGVNSFYDGIQAYEGMRILALVMDSQHPTLPQAIQTGVLNHDHSITLSSWSSYSQEYAYIRQGKKYGKKVLSITTNTVPLGSDIPVSWRFHSAKILKNTTNYTFISPFVDISANMKLKFNGNNFVTLNDGNNTKTQWLSINKVNSTVYCVLHPNIVTPLVSQESGSDRTPWIYEVRSFFKTSDFNPFYCYSAPHLVLYKNNMEYGGILDAISADIEAFKSGGVLGVKSFSSFYQDIWINYSNPLKLSASYVQPDGASWESYRWTLLNKNGEILQDSGKKYDRELAVVFEGLSEPTSSSSHTIYYVVLQVEDTLKNVLSYGIQIVIRHGDVPSNGLFPFNASFDCGLSAVKLEYNGAANVLISYRDGDNDKTYIPESPIWDNGIVYSGEGAELTYAGQETGAIIDYSKGSVIDGSDAVPYNPYSLCSIAGAPYYRLFTGEETTSEKDSDEALAVPEHEDNGQVYFETEIVLNKNHCGNVFEFYVQGENENLVGDLSFDENGQSSSLKGYLVFSLETENNFLSASASLSNVNPNRNRFMAKLKRYSSVDGTSVEVSRLIEKIKLFEDNRNPEYYLQPASSYTESELDHISFLNYDLGQQPLYVRKDKNGEYFSGDGRFFLGNLCLVGNSFSSSRPNLLYWVENRPFLATPSSAQRVTNLENGYQYNADGNTNLLKWPGTDSSYSEENFYWNDVILSPSSVPYTWENVDAGTPCITKIVAMDKHYAMDKKKYHITLLMNDASSIYSLFTTASSITLEEDSSTAEGFSRILIKNGTSYLGEITIVQEVNQ